MIQGYYKILALGVVAKAPGLHLGVGLRHIMPK
jgi:hypothetical protein